MSLALGRSVSLCICRRTCCRNSFDSSVLRKPVESLVTVQLSLHPIERPLLCQTRAKRFRGFTGVAGHMFDLMVQFLVGHLEQHADQLEGMRSGSV